MEQLLCLLCRGAISFADHSLARYQTHLKIEHNVFYAIDWVIQKTLVDNNLFGVECNEEYLTEPKVEWKEEIQQEDEEFDNQESYQSEHSVEFKEEIHQENATEFYFNEDNVNVSEFYLDDTSVDINNRNDKE